MADPRRSTPRRQSTGNGGTPGNPHRFSWMKTRRAFIPVTILAVAGIVFALAFGVFSGDGSDLTAPAAAQDQEELDTDSPVLDSDLAEQADTRENRKAVRTYLDAKGFGPNSYCFDICVKHTVDRGATAVAEQALLTNEDLVQWVNSDSERAKQTRERARRLLSPANYDRFLSGRGHVRVQFTKPISYSQTTQFVDGQMSLVTGGRDVQAGDILFVFVAEEKSSGGRTESKVDDNGSVRGDCGNGHSVPSPQGGPPPGGPGPGPGPGPEPEGRHPPQPGGDELGGGRPPQEGDQYGDEHRRIPGTPGTPRRRPIIDPDTPVRTPPGTGGEIRQGDPPPQNDSGGGTVTGPTAPPTPAPGPTPGVEPPSTTPAPPPAQGAPPPPPPAASGAPPPPE